MAEFDQRFRKRGMAFLSVALLCFSVAGTGIAQNLNPGELGSAYELIRAGYERGQHGPALRMVEEVIDYWGDASSAAVGDRFGHFYYLKGLLHMELEEFDQAARAFETCYQNFPDKSLNQFVVQAKALEASCWLVTENFDDAIRLFQEVLSELDAESRDPHPAEIMLNLARAYLRSGDDGEGMKILHLALDNPEADSRHREAAFAVAVEDWSPSKPADEVRAFVDQYGEIARNAPTDRRLTRDPIFQFLGQQALKNEDPLMALVWFAQVTPASEAISWFESQIEVLKLRKPSEGHPNMSLWEEQLKERVSELEKKRIQISNLIYATGAAHYRLRNFMAAFVVFQNLADNFPNHPQKVEIFFNTVATAVKIEKWDSVREYGILFLDRFPEHKLASQVVAVIVESAFSRENYEEAWKTAQEVRARFEIGSPARDAADFVAGASLFHLDRFRESRVELEAYLIHYPDGSRTEQVRYYLGAANAREFRWVKSAEIFDRFLSDFPDSTMRSSALLLGGLSHFALGRYDRSLDLVTSLQRNHPEAEEIPASWNLTGDILAIREPGASHDEVVAAYSKARDTARARGREPDEEIASYAVWKLIAICGASSKWKQCVEHFDDFQRHHSGSSHRLDALAAALEALYREERAQEALAMLENFIREFESDPIRFEELFGTYFAYLERHFSRDEMVSRLQHFAGTTESPAVKHWLLLARIDRARKSKTPDLPNLFSELDAAVASPAMPNLGLIRMARHHREGQKRKRARELYLEVIENRPERGHLEMAVLDLATLDSESDDAAARESAFQNFSRIIDEFENPELYEPAVIGLARIHFDEGNFEEAEYYLSFYLSRNHWTGSRAEANFKLARCYAESGRKQEAIKLFAITYVNFPGNLEWSTSAYLGAAKLLKESQRDGDALLVLVDFLKRLGHLDHQNIAEGRKLFAQWKADWVATKAAEK